MTAVAQSDLSNVFVASDQEAGAASALGLGVVHWTALTLAGPSLPQSLPVVPMVWAPPALRALLMLPARRGRLFVPGVRAVVRVVQILPE